MDFRMFRPKNAITLGRMLWVALAVAVLTTTSSPEAQAQTYTIRPGDTLRVEVLEDSSLNRSVLVAPDGRISVPSAGSISTSGQSVESVQRILTNRLAGNFASPPNVFVSLERLFVPTPQIPTAPLPPEMITVYVMGEASRPGKLEVLPGTNVLQLFAVMGGFTNFAAKKRIQLRRVDPKTHVQSINNLNYKSIEAGGQGGQTTLQDGDTIIVPQRRLFE